MAKQKFTEQMITDNYEKALALFNEYVAYCRSMLTKYGSYEAWCLQGWDEMKEAESYWDKANDLGYKICAPKGFGGWAVAVPENNILKRRKATL